MQDENKFAEVIDDLELEKVIGGVNYDWMRTGGKPDSSQIEGSIIDYRNDPEPIPSDKKFFVQPPEADPTPEQIVSQGSGVPDVGFGPSQPGMEERRFATVELTHF